MDELDYFLKKLAKLTEMAEQEMSCEYYYQPISVSILLKEIDPSVDYFTLRIVQGKKNFEKHFLEVVVAIEGTNQTLFRPLEYGDKKVILEYLKNPNAPMKIIDAVEAIIDDL